jgi:hypothetical protein
VRRLPSSAACAGCLILEQTSILSTTIYRLISATGRARPGCGLPVAGTVSRLQCALVGSANQRDRCTAIGWATSLPRLYGTEIFSYPSDLSRISQCKAAGLGRRVRTGMLKCTINGTKSCRRAAVADRTRFDRQC